MDSSKPQQIKEESLSDDEVRLSAEVVPITDYVGYLAKQGLSTEDEKQMALAPLTPEQVSELLGWTLHHSGVLIPYPGSDYIRVRMLGGSIKYLSRKKSGCAPPYRPANRPWSDIAVDVRQDIIIAEGEFKAWTACKAGANCLGIGGVDMQETLFDSDIEWNQRRVFIAFDKDAGFSTGDYKPEVGRALGRLAVRLQSRGAKVWVMNLPGDKDEKVGLDDYLRSGGGLAELYSSAVVPPEYCEHLAQLLETCVYVVGTNHTHVYNLENGSRKSVGDFHEAHVEKRKTTVPEAGKKPRVEQLSKTWVLHADRQTARHYTLNPRLPFGMAGLDINLWRPYPTFDDFELLPSVTPEWQKFMEGLFGDHWRWVACWTSHLLNRPEEKAHAGVFVRTRVKNIGKGLFSEIVGRLAGSHYCECKPAEMLKQFNAKMEAKTFVAVHELSVTFKISEDEINNLVTSETYDIEPKGKDVINLPDLRRWYLTSNASSPMRMSKDQRRWLVVNPPRTTADTLGPWNVWIRSVIAKYKTDGTALRTIREWFDHELAAWEKEFGRWEPEAPPPQTAEGLLIADSSMTSNQTIATEVIEWITENGGLGVISPSDFKLRSKIFAEAISMAQAEGGRVGKKTIKVDGKSSDYYIVGIGDAVTDDFEKVPRRADKYVGKVGNEQLLEVGAGLWRLVQALHAKHAGTPNEKF